jgi:hypothetical protein
MSFPLPMPQQAVLVICSSLGIDHWCNQEKTVQKRPSLDQASPHHFIADYNSYSLLLMFFWDLSHARINFVSEFWISSFDTSAFLALRNLSLTTINSTVDCLFD